MFIGSLFASNILYRCRASVWAVIPIFATHCASYLPNHVRLVEVGLRYMYCGRVCSHLNIMESKHMHVSCTGYGAAIDACAKAGRWEEACGLLDEPWLKGCICKLHMVGMGPQNGSLPKIRRGNAKQQQMFGPTGTPNADQSLNLSGMGRRWKVALCTRPKPSPRDPEQTHPCSRKDISIIS